MELEEIKILLHESRNLFDLNLSAKVELIQTQKEAVRAQKFHVAYKIMFGVAILIGFLCLLAFLFHKPMKISDEAFELLEFWKFFALSMFITVSIAIWCGLEIAKFNKFGKIGARLKTIVQNVEGKRKEISNRVSVLNRSIITNSLPKIGIIINNDLRMVEYRGATFKHPRELEQPIKNVIDNINVLAQETKDLIQNLENMISEMNPIH